MPSSSRCAATREPSGRWSLPTTARSYGAGNCHAPIHPSRSGARKQILTLTSTASFPKPRLRPPPLLAGTPLTTSANWVSDSPPGVKTHFKEQLFSADLLTGGNVFRGSDLLKDESIGDRVWVVISANGAMATKSVLLIILKRHGSLECNQAMLGPPRPLSNFNKIVIPDQKHILSRVSLGGASQSGAYGDLCPLISSRRR